MKTSRPSKTPYLWDRPNTDSFWFSRPVPKRLWESGKPRVIQFSLKTTEREQAKALVRMHAARLDEEWGLVDAPQATADGTPESHLYRHYYRKLGDNLRGRLEGTDDEEYQQRAARFGQHRDQLVREFNRNDLSRWERQLDKRIEASDWGIDKDTPEYQRMLEVTARSAIEAFDVQVRKVAGDLGAEPRSSVVQKLAERENAKAKPGERLTDLFEIYAAEILQAGRKRQAGIDQDRMVVQQFAEFTGSNVAVAAIGYDEAKAYVDALPKIPLSYKKRKAYAALSVHKAIEKGESIGAATLSPITQQRYISTLSPLFDWLKSERGGRRVTANPFDGLHLDISKIKKKNPRPPFTADQITTIIHSPLFTGFQRDGKEHVAGNMRADDWRYWLPLICLFTGARIGEVAQLRVDDIFSTEGILCVEFRHDAATGQQTKNEKSRVVALHSTLLNIGLLEFVERRRDRSERDGNPQMFPALESGPRSQFGDMPSKWWRKYLDRIGVKAREGKDGFGSHSFRHTMADQLRASGHLDDVFGPLIIGHSKGGVTAGYGQARQGTPKLSHDMIESVRFVPIERGRAVEGGEPVNFSHLLDSTAGKSRKPS